MPYGGFSALVTLRVAEWERERGLGYRGGWKAENRVAYAKAQAAKKAEPESERAEVKPVKVKVTPIRQPKEPVVASVPTAEERAEAKRASNKAYRERLKLKAERGEVVRTDAQREAAARRYKRWAAKLTPEQLEERRKKRTESNRAWLAKLTPEQREEIKRKKTEYQREYRGGAKA